MPPSAGFSLDTDAWLRDFEEAKELAQDTTQIIQERNLDHPEGGPEASRLTAAARRKLGSLGTQVEKLAQWLDSAEASSLGEQERFRRRDMVYALKARREQILSSLKRSQGGQDRTTLFDGAAGRSRVAGQETERTAELDTRGLVQLQEQVMGAQDQELEQMEKAVVSTKHIALTIGEEVDLHTRLLDELDEDVDVTQSRLRAATKRIRHVMKESAHWKMGLFLFLLIIALVVVLIVGFKLARLFG